MFSKIFETIYDGTLRRDWQALVVFQQLLILADWEGIIHKTPEALAARTGIPLEIINHGLSVLSQPDVDSRNRQSEGRRIVLLDPNVNWGWTIVNFVAYRSIKTTEDLRDYWRGKQRDYRTATLAEKTQQVKQMVSEMFKRKADDSWTYLEQSMLAEVSRRTSVMDEFSEIKTYRRKAGKYFPQSVSKLLENWTNLLDRARNGAASSNKGPNI